MNHLSKLLMLGVVILCGCVSNHYKRGSGDAGQFIVQQAIIRGGTPITTNNLPLVGGKWSYSEDQYGVVIHLPREKFLAVESLLSVAFGQPMTKLSNTNNGVRFGAYRLTAKGGGIQFFCDEKETQVIIIRPLSKKSFLIR